MRIVIAAAFVAVSMLSTALTAQAASFDDYPGWAQRAFEQGTYGG